MAGEFIFRARRYWSLHADPRIGECTDFFAAAAVVTRTLGLGSPSPFMRNLSERLEGVNYARALDIRAGRLYRTGSVAGNTADFVRYEQTWVQVVFDDLKARDPRQYSREIRIANHSLKLASRRPWCTAIDSSFTDALASTLLQWGGAVDMARQHWRETLGVHLARLAAHL